MNQDTSPVTNSDNQDSAVKRVTLAEYMSVKFHSRTSFVIFATFWFAYGHISSSLIPALIMPLGSIAAWYIDTRLSTKESSPLQNTGDTASH